MFIKRGIAAIAASTVLLVGLAACSSASDAAPGGESSGDPVSIKYAVVGEPGADALPGIWAVNSLAEKYGYDVEIVQVAEAALAIEGLSSDQFQLGSNAASVAFNAVLNDADVTMIGAETGMSWIMQTKPGIETCADLAGKVIGLHAAGSAGEGYFKYWQLLNCTPEEQANLHIVYVPGSEARAQALLAGQLDATMITYTELPLVEDSTETMFEFRDVGDLNDLAVGSGLLAGGPFMESHPEVVTQFLEEVVRGQALMTDRESVLDAIGQALPNLTGDLADQAATATIESGSILQEGGLSVMENMPAIVDFMVNTTAELPDTALDRVDDFADPSFLRSAIENVGG